MRFFFSVVIAIVSVSVSLADRPNIVLIMADDLGWMDLHCQGNKRVDTPHIDALAKQGMRFTNAYAAAPVCSPTRAAMMTGMAPARLRLTNHISNRDFTPKDATLLPASTLKHLPLEHVTIAERLKKSGYATGFLGKWHLAGQPKAQGKGLTQFYPEHQGFDLNLGGCAHGGPPSYFDPYRIHNLPNRKKGEYLPDRLADEAIRFIREKKDKPFFLTLWNYTVHWPMEAPKKLIEKYQKRLGRNLKDARYGAMIEAMDASIGRILSSLEKMSLTKKTLVIFTSDNGGFSGVADNRPLRSGKGYLYEGGIRVPLIVRWPGVVKSGSLCKEPVISMDFFPTFLEVTGLKENGKSALDGISLMPLLRGKKVSSRALYFHYPNYAWHSNNRLGGAIREGKHKLIVRYGNEPLELYDLEKDLSEKNNLAEKLPERAATMKEKLYQWLKATGATMPVKKE